jgi:hypothetical protein
MVLLEKPEEVTGAIVRLIRRVAAGGPAQPLPRG